MEGRKGRRPSRLKTEGEREKAVERERGKRPERLLNTERERRERGEEGQRD